jgi:hypothetical protein
MSGFYNLNISLFVNEEALCDRHHHTDDLRRVGDCQYGRFEQGHKHLCFHLLPPGSFICLDDFFLKGHLLTTY